MRLLDALCFWCQILVLGSWFATAWFTEWWAVLILSPIALGAAVGMVRGTMSIIDHPQPAKEATDGTD